MHAYLVVGSTHEERQKKVKQLLDSLEVAEFENFENGKKHLISTVRSLNKKLLIPAIDPNKNRAYVIYEANLLTQDAANAFLKTLEEPPQKTIFILTAPNKDAVVETLVSRSQVIELTGESIILSQEELDKSQKNFNLLTTGNLSDRMKILDQIGDREEGIVFLVGQTIQARKLLQEKLKKKSSSKKIVELIDRLDLTRADLQANVNTKIAISDLLLNYPQL